MPLNHLFGHKTAVIATKCHNQWHHRISSLHEIVYPAFPRWFDRISSIRKRRPLHQFSQVLVETSEDQEYRIWNITSLFHFWIDNICSFLELALDTWRVREREITTLLSRGVWYTKKTNDARRLVELNALSFLHALMLMARWQDLTDEHRSIKTCPLSPYDAFLQQVEKNLTENG